MEFIRKYSFKDAPDDLFGSLAIKIFEYQYEKNLNYRKFCSLQGKKPGYLEHWKDIPAIPTAGFKELALTSFPLKNAIKTFKTSGTTQAGRGVHFFDTLRLYESSIVPSFKAFMIPDSADLSFHFLVASPKDSPESSLSHMMGVVDRVFAKRRGKFYVQKDQMNCDALMRNLISEKKKVFILATAFSLKIFLDHLKRQKVRVKLPRGSRLMETGGFKGKVKEVSKERLYGECGKMLGIDRYHCVSEYGMTELSSQCYDTTLVDKLSGIKRKPFKKGPAWLRTLVIDPKTGKETKKGNIGILSHFDLANRGSVLAIQTEDLGRKVGDGFELLGRASGAELRGCSLSYEEFLNS